MTVRWNPPYGKRWRLYILPQYLANLTQPISTLKVIFFYEILSCTNSIVYARFEVFKSFLCVFMSLFRVFVRNELWVKLPVAIFFGTVDWDLDVLKKTGNRRTQRKTFRSKRENIIHWTVRIRNPGVLMGGKCSHHRNTLKCFFFYLTVLFWLPSRTNFARAENRLTASGNATWIGFSRKSLPIRSETEHKWGHYL